METHQDQPVYHLYDPSGWVNDPNGPLYYKGQYHMFFQNVTDSTQWTWGLGWGHATSTDLLHWRQLPVALSPDPGWYDADGCFSGCATVDADGVPAILYTGVVKKPDAGEREGMPLTVNKLCWERQLIARPANPDDPDLTEWVKEPLPFLSDHLSGLPINCFRDPFILERPAADNGWRWRVMVGSNIDMAELAAAAAEPAPPVAAAAAAGGGSGEAGSRAPGAVQQQQQLSAAAQQEREQLKRAAAALQAAGWMGSNEGLSGGFTLGTATVYRSLTKELEGGWEYEGLLCVAKPGEGAIWECPILAPLTQPTAGDVAAAAAAMQPFSPAPTAAPPLSAEVTAEQPGRAASGQLKGAVGAVAETLRVQQAEVEQAERAMSGCLGLWKTAAPPGSGAASAAAASPATAVAQQQQEDLASFTPTHLFSVSAGVAPAIYWLGRYRDGKFDLATADGPYALDLGDVVYAPNLLEDAQGRQVVWSWLQEHPSHISHDYSGCISLPRQLQLGVKRRSSSLKRRASSTHTSLPPGVFSSSSPGSTPQGQQQQQQLRQTQQAWQGNGDAQQQQQQDRRRDGDSTSDDGSSSSSSEVEYYLHQSPLPELEALRSGRGLRLRGVRLPPGKPWSVPSQVSASHVDLNLTVRPTPGAQRFQLLLGPLRQDADQQLQQQQDLPVMTSQDLTGSSALPMSDSTPLPSAAAAPSGAAETAAELASIPEAGPAPPTPALAAVPAQAPGLASTVLGAAGEEAALAAVEPTALRAVPAAAGALAAMPAAVPPTPLSFIPMGGRTVADAAAGLSALDSAAVDIAASSLSGSLLPAPPAPVLTAPQAGLAVLTGPVGAGHIPSFPDSPGEGNLPPMLPLLPSMSGTHGSAAGINGVPGAATSSTGLSAEAAAAQATPFASLVTQQAGADAGASALPGAAGDDSLTADQMTALAAAAAAEQVALEHHQAAAITYEFATSQVQVLIGPPGPLLKLLKQQQQEMAAAAAATATAATSATPAAAPVGVGAMLGGDSTTSSVAAQLCGGRTNYPTADALGYEPPTLPPAPCGALTMITTDIIAEAEAAGVRVLGCQLRDLDPDEPLELRVLLDYSIMEVFFLRTGEALTTRVYRGVPTARAKEVSMKKIAAHAASEAIVSELEVNSMSGSLQGLGQLFHQQQSHLILRSGSGRLLAGAHSMNCLYPAGPGYLSPGLSGVSGFSSPAAGSPRLTGSPRLGGAAVRTSLDSLPGSESPSALQQPAGVQRLPHHQVPVSPATAATGSYVHYFSPHRNWSARVGIGTRHAASLPTLAGISELPGELAPAAAAAAAAAAIAAQAGDSEGARISNVAAGLFGLGGGGVPAVEGPGPGPAMGADGDAGAEAVAGLGHKGSRHRQLFIDVDNQAAQGDASSSSSTTPAVEQSTSAPESSTAGVGQQGDGSSSGTHRTSSESYGTTVSEELETEVSDDTFPGFSPHKPARHRGKHGTGDARAWPDAGPRAAEMAGSAGIGAEGKTESRESSSAGAKLASWFSEKLGRKSSRGKLGKGFTGEGSSSSSVVVPPTFGVPVAPRLESAAVGAGAAGIRDTSGVNDQLQQQQQASAGQGVTEVPSSSVPELGLPKSGLHVRTSSGPERLAAAATTGQQVANGGAAASAAAAAAIDKDTDASSAVRHQQQQQQQQRCRGLTPLVLGSGSPTSPAIKSPNSTRASSAAGSPFAMGRSPRRNWRSAFVFTESDDDDDDTAAAADGQQGVRGVGAGGRPAMWGGLRGKLAAAQAQLAREAEYGLYAKVFASGFDGAGTSAPSGAPAAGKAESTALGGAALGGSSGVAGGKQVSSGYMPGAMRELSLVALGGGGVVLRLEAYEMASMWDNMT